MAFPPADKPVFILTPTAEVREYSQEAQSNECYIDVSKIQSFNINCLDMGGYPSRSGNATTSNIPVSGTSPLISPSAEVPDEEYFYITPRKGTLPGEDMSKIAEADNKYNEQEIRER